MEILATLFAGIGLLFIGIKTLGSNLRHMTGPKARELVTRATSNSSAAAALGLLAGAVMQSINAVIFVLISLVTTGVMDVKRAHPIINWANLGTSLLVLLATLNLHIMVLILVGLTGLAFYFGLDKSSRYGHLIGALLGIGLLFLGVDFIKHGAEPLKYLESVHEFVTYSRESLLIAFLIGLGFTLFTQSASTITVVAMTMATAGALDLDSSLMIVIGAGLGSGISTLMLAYRFTGLARQLALYQMTLKTLGATSMLALFLIESWSGLPLLRALLELITNNIALQIALSYVLFQLVSDIAIHFIHHRVSHYLARLAPPTTVETLSKPRYLYDEGLQEGGSALVLVEKEQQRLLTWLPNYLNELRSDAGVSKHSAEELFSASQTIIQECERFLGSLMDQNRGRDTFDRASLLKARNDLQLALQETLYELVQQARLGMGNPDVQTLLEHLVEALHMLMMTLNDAVASGDADDIQMLRMLSRDRSDMMEGIRRRLFASSAEAQQCAFSATSLFERAVWLCSRYVLQLERSMLQNHAATTTAEEQRV